MAVKCSGSLWKPALAFLAGICLSLIAGGALLASSAPEAPTQRPQAQSPGPVMPSSSGDGGEGCGCGE